VREGLAAFGEIGLTGRLRPAAQSERRLEECAKLGVAAVVAPEGTRSRSKIRVSGSATLRDAMRAALEARDENPRKSA
jgi:DNA repair protein RadA/Sms